jgi:hypothetical protein
VLVKTPIQSHRNARWLKGDQTDGTTPLASERSASTELVVTFSLPRLIGLDPGLTYRQAVALAAFPAARAT